MCATTRTAVLNDQSLVVDKVVSGATGDDGDALSGDVLTYTVTVTHTGNLAYAADRPARVVDDLTDVLDDAVAAPASVRAGSGEATLLETQLHWTGPLAPGESVAITYTVTVPEPAAGLAVPESPAPGDAQVRNVAFAVPYTDATGDWEAGVDPLPVPAECPDCARTTTAVAEGPELAVTKTVEGSASVLRPGATLTWTVTGTNTGDTSFDGALRRAIVVDDLVDVLDDARLGTSRPAPGRCPSRGRGWCGAAHWRPAPR